MPGDAAPAALDWFVPGDAIEAPAPGSFVEACATEQGRASLLYFLVNVGDGDMQLLLLPEDGQGVRRAVVVDVAVTGKLPALLESLAGEDLLDLDTDRLFPLVVGTHPHRDHIGGMPEFLRRFGPQVDEYWDPGYYHPSASYIETLVALEDCPGIRRTQPAGGTTSQVGTTRLTVLAPGIGLRNRFDSYGVLVNDASIALKVEFPAVRVASMPDERDPQHRNRVYLQTDPWSLVLGADAQTTAWAQTALDFPELHREHNPALYRELRMGMGGDALRAQVFKVPHHASKHGLNIELVERIRPLVALVSSSSGGRYGFPHLLAVEAVREAVQATTATGAARIPDHRLGIHYTCAVTAGEHPADGDEDAPGGGDAPGDGDGDGDGGATRPLGTIALVVPPRRGQDLQMWRFGDARDDAVDLARARRMSYLRRLED